MRTFIIFAHYKFNLGNISVYKSNCFYENKERNKNYKYIGIELTEEYLPISKARIEYVCNLEPEIDNQTSIFDFIGTD